MKKNKLVYLLLAAFMLTSVLSACNAGIGNTAEQTTPATEGTNEVTPDANELVTFDLFVNHSWFPVREWSGSVPEAITEKTGVTMNVTVAADDKQLPLMIASGDLPDLVFTASNLDRLSNSDISYAWDELIAQYAPDFVVDKTRIAIHTKEDGHYYTIRNNFATQEEWDAAPSAVINSASLGLRKDILEAVGNPELNSLEDLEALFGTVKSEYPDMIPLILDKNWGVNYFRMQYGVPSVYTDLYVNDDGQVNYYIEHPGMLEVYKYINRLYRNGYLIAENFAFKDPLMDNEYVINGTAFAHAENTNDIDDQNGQIRSNGDDYSYTQLMHTLSDAAKTTYASVGWAGVFITKNNKDPESAIKFMQFMFTEEGQKLGFWGIEGKHYKYNTEEKYPELLYTKGDSEYVNAEGIGFWGLMSNSAALEQVQMNTESAKVKKLATDIALFVPELGMLIPDSDSDEGIILTKLKEMIATEEVNIYMANSDEAVLGAYNEMMNKAEQIGLATYKEWLNAEYQRILPLFN
jgi:putative aldouronate transport system substrate-binding protein